jgi:hypothetical protein
MGDAGRAYAQTELERDAILSRFEAQLLALRAAS